MAVVPPGFFGNYFYQYGNLNDSRDWNTKSYDYAVVKNKGEIGEEARNEDSTNLNTATDPKLFGKGLFVKANKNFYVTATGEKYEEKTNPIYQIRNSDDKVDNNYYVDQKTGDVYFRPVNSTTAGRPANNTISLQATSPINDYEPQYFGTTFHLERAPNPEDIGALGNTNINLLVNGGAGNSYNELIVNGVPIQVGDLNTNTITASAPTPANSLYTFSNSFTVAPDNFSPISGNWTHDSAAGNYVSNAAGVSNFNQRTLDNFIMRIKIRDNAGGVGTNAGVQLRATRTDDSIETSGYYLYIDNGGAIRLNKAGFGNVTLLNVPPVNGGDLEIRMNGTQIIVNSVVIFDDNDANLYGQPYLDGNTSLRTQTNAIRRFDDFEVLSYPTPIQLLSKAFKAGENSIVVKSYDTARVNVDLVGTVRDIRRGANFDININTGNLLPDLRTLNAGTDPSITSRLYRDDAISGLNTYLDDDRAYWSVSQRSALGIAGKIVFVNKEGGSIQKTKNQFTDINSVMTTLNSLLGAQDDLFNGHLGLIR